MCATVMHRFGVTTRPGQASVGGALAEGVKQKGEAATDRWQIFGSVAIRRGLWKYMANTDGIICIPASRRR